MNREQYKERKAQRAKQGSLIIDVVPREPLDSDSVIEVITEVSLNASFFWKTPEGKLNMFGNSIIFEPGGATIVADAAGVELASPPVFQKTRNTITVKGMSFPVVSDISGRIVYRKLSNTGVYQHYGYSTTRDVELLVMEEWVNDAKRKYPKYTNPETLDFDLFKFRVSAQKHAEQIVDTKLRKSGVKCIGLPNLMLGDENAILFLVKYVLKNPQATAQLSIPQDVGFMEIANDHPEELRAIEAVKQESVEEVAVQDVTTEECTDSVTYQPSIFDTLLDWTNAGLSVDDSVLSFADYCIKNKEVQASEGLVEFFRSVENGNPMYSKLANSTLALSNPVSKEAITSLINARDVKGIYRLVGSIR